MNYYNFLYNLNMQNISTQNKINLKERVSKLINGLKERTDLLVNFEYQGSIIGPGIMKVNEEGYYDIDIDLIVSTDLGAQEVYSSIKNTIKNYSLRKIEVLESKTNAVICIKIDEDGHKYKIDIAIFNIKNNVKKKMNKKDTSYI